MAAKLKQLVEEQNAVMGEAHLSWSNGDTATQQRRCAERVMGRAERA